MKKLSTNNKISQNITKVNPKRTLNYIIALRDSMTDEEWEWFLETGD